MFRCSLLFALLLPSVAQAGDGFEPFEIDLDVEDVDPMVNSDAEDGWPQAVSLGAGPISMCSGSLITPRLILTAGHCGADMPIELVVQLGSATFGPAQSSPDVQIGFANFALHPDYVPLGGGGLTQSLPEFDLAILELEEDAPYKPIWFNTEPLDDKILNKKVTSVGFGITSAAGEGGGVKRSAKLTVDSYDDMFINSLTATNANGSQICSGDSGGPQYRKDPDTGEWIQYAVHSWGDQNCLFESGSTRTDVGAEFILEIVELAHGTTDVCEIFGRYGDGTCDEDCDVVDVDCPPPGLGDGEGGIDGNGSESPKGGCDSTGSTPAFAWLALLPLLGLRRRSP